MTKYKLAYRQAIVPEAEPVVASRRHDLAIRNHHCVMVRPKKVAIECKRYLERNMLDECSGTAEKFKKATPYCLYIIVSEFLKMDNASPELSRIDEIYVLRKQRNSERLADGFVPNPIYGDLVVEIYRQVQRHLSRVWWPVVTWGATVA